MNSFYCRWWLAGAALLSAASVQAETIPITLSMKAIGDLDRNNQLPFGEAAPNTLTLSTRKSPFHADSPTFIELTLSAIAPDSVNRMLEYKLGDPPSYEWTITAENAAAFGVNWLALQGHLNESKPSDSSTEIRFFNALDPSPFDPVVGTVQRMGDALRMAGVHNEVWVTDFRLHEVKISIDYYFWHPILEGLRGVQIQAEVRGEARLVPEPAALAILSLGLILISLLAPQRGERSSERMSP